MLHPKIPDFRDLPGMAESPAATTSSVATNFTEAATTAAVLLVEAATTAATTAAARIVEVASTAATVSSAVTEAVTSSPVPAVYPTTWPAVFPPMAVPQPGVSPSGTGVVVVAPVDQCQVP